MRKNIVDKVHAEQAALRQAKAFPVEAFPPAIQDIILSTNKTLLFPVDYIGSAILFAASVAVGNSVQVKVKNGFYQKGILYMALVGMPGSAKTPPVKFALSPLTEVDTESYFEYKRGIAQYEAAMDKPKTDRTDIPKKPTLRKTIMSDFTPEILVQRLLENPRGIGVFRDELAGWMNSFDRYNKGGEEQFWLEIWSSAKVNVDRKGSEPILIPEPVVSVLGTIQPKILQDMAKGSRSQNGFMDRILFAMPDSLSKQPWTEDELPDSVEENWRTIVKNLLKVELHTDDNGSAIPQTLEFSDEAKKALFAWQEQNTYRCNNADSEYLQGIYTKLDAYAARLSLVMEMLYVACNQTSGIDISLVAVEAAIALVEYFRSTAENVHNIIHESNKADFLTKKKKLVYELLPEQFEKKAGVEVAKECEMSERTFSRFVKDASVFRNLSHGKYEKLW